MDNMGGTTAHFLSVANAGRTRTLKKGPEGPFNIQYAAEA